MVSVDNEKDMQHYGSFRDRAATINDDGSRSWIYPKKPKGKKTKQRWIVASILLSLLFIGPWIKYKGEPFLLFNILERKFIIFGQLFWPQDFHLVVLGIITLIVFVILFTVIFGRIFCGWVCPQTIFMEFIFRQIEYLIEGDFNKQKKLTRQSWNFEKIWKKTLKHLVFFGIAFLISNTFLAYIIGIEELKALVTNGPIENLGTFIALLIFSGVFYFVFAFFREQVCFIACPYGRLQGVLLDDQSIVVAYDYKRGEPKGKYNPLENRSATGKGDCIDCQNCVSVCPTGIDIRNGTQLECINCTACIDACDSIMDRVKLPRGLIRYASERGISEGKNKLFNARSIAYSVFLTLLLIVVASLFTFRSDVESTILRVPGTLFQEYGPENYSNIFKIQLVNKTRLDMPIELLLESPEGQIVLMGDPIMVPGGQVTESNFLLVLPKSILKSSNTAVIIGVFSNSKRIDAITTTFIGPNALDY
ncbi:MAG: cytochrome c oxidase accessory protein CcoG [Bacteroidetes bacterium HGW-Bacteroidetes-1]|jgi:cytochrome c oxidase accessory protein FixG|nr:MAG: cytochrome c oxidase accessory protein CcoG [Bacteroidetes bacterium HGW-Bacteroidetes-1]